MNIKSKKKKFGILLISLSLVLVLMLSGCSGSAKGGKTLAVVNGVEITETQFNQRYNIIAGQYDFDPKNTEHLEYQKELKEQVLNSLIDEAVLMQEATKKGLAVTEEEINEEIAMFKTSFSSTEEFTNYLKQYLKLTEEEFKNVLRNDLLVGKVYSEVTGEINSTSKSAKEYFEKNKELFAKGEEVSATHVLVKTEEEAKQIIKDIKAGADMNEIAAEKSTDESAKMNKGDLGYFGRGRMVEPFDKAVFSMKVGEISEPVQSEFGYHVIRLDDKTAGENVSFNDVEQEIKLYLIEEEKNDAFMKHILELREAAAIEIK